MKSASFYELIRQVIEKNLHRSIKFSISGWVGFGFVELFTYVLFHLLSVGNLASVTSAFLIGVAVEYIINEYWTAREAKIHDRNALGIIKRLFKFEIINLGGTAVSIGVQYILFFFLGLEPLIGNLVGSGLAFPLNYYLQMKITFGIDVS